MVKINRTLLINKKDKIWTETANKNRIIKDFKKLYKHTNEEKNWDVREIAENIKIIMNTITGNLNINKKEDKLYTPILRLKTIMDLTKKIL